MIVKLYSLADEERRKKERIEKILLFGSECRRSLFFEGIYMYTGRESHTDSIGEGYKARMKLITPIIESVDSISRDGPDVT